jgi:hypothetical protein
LQYAAGFSDTDGCFHVHWKRQRFYISQAEKGIAALHFMYDTFGGEVTIHKKGNERHQTSYDWILCFEDAVKYTKAIMDYLIIKKREAIVFVDATLTLNELDTKLRHYHNTPHDNIPDDIVPSKAYIAGLIDGEVCFQVNGKSGQHHSVTQKYRPMLDMLHRLYGGTVFYRKGSDTYGWEVYTEAKRLVQDIAPYIRGKKKQVELLLNMKPGEAPQVHVKLRQLKGNFTAPTPRIDALKAGAPGIKASVAKPHTDPKELPAGVFYQNKEKTRIKAQIQYKKKVYVIGFFEPSQVNEAHKLYLEYKNAISLEKRGGPKVEFEDLTCHERK